MTLKPMVPLDPSMLSPQYTIYLATSIIPPFFLFNHLCGDLLSDDVLQRDGISSELADSLTQLLNRHLLLVEVEAEERLVLDV